MAPEGKFGPLLGEETTEHDRRMTVFGQTAHLWCDFRGHDERRPHHRIFADGSSVWAGPIGAAFAPLPMLRLSRPQTDMTVEAQERCLRYSPPQGGLRAAAQTQDYFHRWLDGSSFIFFEELPRLGISVTHRTSSFVVDLAAAAAEYKRLVLRPVADDTD